DRRRGRARGGAARASLRLRARDDQPLYHRHRRAPPRARGRVPTGPTRRGDLPAPRPGAHRRRPGHYPALERSPHPGAPARRGRSEPTMPRAANPSTEAPRARVDALLSHGVQRAAPSPGSRPAPLAYALARAESRGRIEVHVRIDERVAAFTALGLARFGPAAVVTTSGTATANLHPALLEARHSGLGLLAITADRPHELRGVGANQTTDQLHMFGPHIPAVEIPAGSTRAAIGNQAARVLAQATGAFGPPGPVHVNIAFREPLVPGDGGGEDEAPIAPGPRVRVRRVGTGAGEVDLSRPSVVVAGDGAGPEAARFAEAAGLPLLAEPSSGARSGANAIGPYQRMLPALAGEVAQV